MTEKDNMKTQNLHLVQKDMQHIHKEKHINTKLTGTGNHSAWVYVLGKSNRLWRDAIQLQRDTGQLQIDTEWLQKDTEQLQRQIVYKEKDKKTQRHKWLETTT